jgi:pilus assembly protein Flp/PilA
MWLIYIDKGLNSRLAQQLLYKGCLAQGWGNQSTERKHMNTMLLKLYVKFQDLRSNEQGQDLVEYALVVALIALGATAGMKALASGINAAFQSVSVALATDI